MSRAALAWSESDSAGRDLVPPVGFEPTLGPFKGSHSPGLLTPPTCRYTPSKIVPPPNFGTHSAHGRSVWPTASAAWTMNRPREQSHTLSKSEGRRAPAAAVVLGLLVVRVVVGADVVERSRTRLGLRLAVDAGTWTECGKDPCAGSIRTAERESARDQGEQHEHRGRPGEPSVPVPWLGSLALEPAPSPSPLPGRIAR